MTEATRHLKVVTDLEILQHDVEYWQFRAKRELPNVDERTLLMLGRATLSLSLLQENEDEDLHL